VLDLGDPEAVLTLSMMLGTLLLVWSPCAAGTDGQHNEQSSSSRDSPRVVPYRCGARYGTPSSRLSLKHPTKSFTLLPLTLQPRNGSVVDRW
jgi:hypothetical protein